MNRVLVVVALILAVSANGVAAEQDGDSYIQKPIVAESVVRGPDGKIKVDIPEQPERAIDMTAGPKPQWIWKSEKSFNNDKIIVTKTINVESVAASLSASCDNSMDIVINGK